ncbi:polyprenyl synthetase family protein [Reichenbachiella versicolor]|uniref:polyprenyl synthetase family protein n=1 Tax=Reichenbachiella versicolor TaxID=1821036 RepID=UPI000D6EB033|nr:polyprenyl synthetase family protein [Reichenbachiella versicolor]
MTDQIKLFQEKLNAELAKMEFGKKPTELYEPLRYTLRQGGKRMRPILAVMAYLTKKQDWESIIAPALSIELFHNFTLIHDDIMDEAPLRRGKETVYKKWDSNIAILSGDALMILAYDLMLEADYDDIKYLIKLFNRCVVEVCEGQQMDMNFETIDTVPEEDYIEMIKLKTSVLLGYSLEMGALLAGMTKEQALKLREFGINIGIGFQLKDDLLDVYGDTAKVGKQIGGDIISNKKTMLLLKALELADEKTKEDLDDLIAATDFDPVKKVDSVKAIYAQLGIKEIAEEKMKYYFDLGFKQLVELKDEDLNLDPLIAFTQALIDRDH